MGGHALKNIKTRRYDRLEFEVAKNDILSKIKVLITNKVDVPKYLYEKKTFGDLDILIGINNDRELVSKTILNYFKPNEISYSGGNTISFNYNDLQVDLIFISNEYFDIAYHYFSWNDFGMLIGKMFNSINLKYTHKGLKYYIYSDKKEVLLNKVFLSKDIETILTILDLDYETYKKGFNNYEEIFVFLKKSKYFCYEIFDKKRITNKDRKRDDVRQSMKIFYVWLEENKDDILRSGYKYSHEETIKIINEYFPDIGINNVIQKYRDKFSMKKKAAKYFNGNLIMQKMPELKGQLLGHYIGLYKQHIKLEYGIPFEEYVLENSESILNIFKLFYQQHKLIGGYDES